MDVKVRFWGWSENKREEAKDFAELSDRVRRGLPLYGESDQPEWIQGVAYRNSAFSQLKMREYDLSSLRNTLVLTSRPRPLPHVSATMLHLRTIFSHLTGSTWSITHTTGRTRRSTSRRKSHRRFCSLHFSSLALNTPEITYHTLSALFECNQN